MKSQGDENRNDGFARVAELTQEIGRGLKPSQKLKALEMAWRMAQMDESAIEKMYEHYQTICNFIDPYIVEKKEKKKDPVKEEEEVDIDAFLLECCVFGDGCNVMASSLYIAFLDWGEERKLNLQISQHRFGRIVGSKFYKKRSTGGAFWYYGVALK